MWKIKMSKQLSIYDSKTQYDYFVPPEEQYIQLTHDGEKASVILCVGNVLASFIEIGKEGYLKGKSYEDYLDLIERR